MWIALLFVMYTDGIPYVESAVAESHLACERMRQEFAQVVREDADIIVEAKSRCIRL